MDGCYLARMRFTVVLVAVMVLLGCGKSSGPPAPPPDASATPGASATPARQARIAKLARGTSVAYALLVDGTIHRWGLVAVRTREDAPVAMTGLVGKFVDVSADRHACAVNDAGEVWCWGENAFGALGNGTSVPLGSSEMGPVKALVSDAKSVCVDGLFSCALHRTGTVSCWGNGPWGRDVHHEVPVLMPGFTRVTSIACGGAHLCAVDEDGVLRCMGRGVAGAWNVRLAPAELPW